MGRQDNKFFVVPNASEQRKINIICLLVRVHREDADYDHLSAPMRTLLLYCLCESQFVKNKKFAVHLRKEHEVGFTFRNQIPARMAKHDTLCLCRGQCAKRNSGRTPPARSVASIRLKDVSCGPICILISRLFVWRMISVPWLYMLFCFDLLPPPLLAILHV